MKISDAMRLFLPGEGRAVALYDTGERTELDGVLLRGEHARR
jgi:hypothetical protein